MLVSKEMREQTRDLHAMRFLEYTEYPMMWTLAWEMLECWMGIDLEDER